MAETPESTTVEPVENEQAQPANWNELKEQTPELKGLPDMVEPCDFTVEQSADFELTLAYAQQLVSKLNAGKKLSREQLLQNIGSSADITVALDRFMHTICKNPEQLDEWNKGKRLWDLYTRYLIMLNFVNGELGK